MSRTHLWKRVYLSIALLVTYFFAVIDNAEIGQLTYCGSSSQSTPQSLIFVSTLDGKISALDAKNHGEKQWTLDFNEGPMLSSSIHRRELNNNGQWVRLIPSLNGGLYKFDGDNLEAVPVSTDQLLHSSFRYSDDLVFSGGKETRSYGVSAKTGKILYECNIKGCTNNTDAENYIEQEVLIIQRFQQTVRAIEPRTGAERWNFSVGQHELVMMPKINIDCSNRSPGHDLDIEIKVIVPEGIIWAVHKSNPKVKLWQYKFDTPVVSIWREGGTNNVNPRGGLEEVNLFDNSQWTWGSDFSSRPGIYLGMHDRQLYIQENTEFSQTKIEFPQRHPQKSKYPWKPYPAVGTAVADTHSNRIQDNSVFPTEANEVQSTTALSVLYSSEYINGNGYYLYSKKQLQLDRNNQCNNTNSDFVVTGHGTKPIINLTDDDDDDDDDDTPVQIIIVSLWYWWKEVLIISITTAILLNFVLTQRLLNATTVAKDAIPPPLIVERHIETRLDDRKTVDENENANNFKSRYLTDFEPVDCLGKGGYGVVFEAKNKIDDCNYAIKRITLPNSRDSRERVMREVKALAKLDHHNIVRYFNAWLECPPAGWQEEHDQQWVKKQQLSTEYPTETTQTETKPQSSVCIDVSKTDPSIDSAREAYELNNINGNNEKNEDSFIVFAKSDDSDSGKEIIDMNDSTSTQTSEISSSHNGTTESSNELEDTNPSDSIVFEKNTNPSDSIIFEKNTNPSESIVFENNTNPSESIMFEEDTKDVKDEKSGKDKEKMKSKKSDRFNLNLNEKPIKRKAAKMFLYIQMQLCQRLSLREWLKQQPSPRDSNRVLDIFYQIVNAVEYVHLQGLIHRDLKPSNIFFAYDDTVKIGDFGLVTAMTESFDEAHTPAGENANVNLRSTLHTACVGTHLYMSPEQMNGQMYNYKVDIYSLGIILFELLTPFDTEMERVIALTNLRKSIFPHGFDADYPAEYELLKIMLDEKPEKRPTTLGIKAKPPLSKYEKVNGLNESANTKWHFELPLLRHSSITSSSSSDSWENVN